MHDDGFGCGTPAGAGDGHWRRRGQGSGEDRAAPVRGRGGRPGCEPRRPRHGVRGAGGGERYADLFYDLDAGRVEVLRIRTGEDALDAGPEVLDVLMDASGIFMTGGSQLRISSALGATPLAALQARPTDRAEGSMGPAPRPTPLQWGVPVGLEAGMRLLGGRRSPQS